MPPTPDNASAHCAAEYDAQIEKTLPYYSSFFQEILRFIKTIHPAPARWLDTGCGTGGLVQKALPRFPSTHFFLADPSAAMLEQARAKLETGNQAPITFLDPSDSQHLMPGVSSHFQVITAIQCHHYCDQSGRQTAIRRCYELLVDGGLLVVFENVRPPSDQAVQIGKQYWIDFQMQAGKSADAARAHLDRFDRDYFPITINQHLALLGDSGFQTVDLLWRSYLITGFYAIK